MLEALLNAPRDINDWGVYSFNLRTENDRVRQAILKDSNGAVNLFAYQLDPINFSEVTEWLARNQQSVDDFNQYLNLPGVDLEGVDVRDPKQLQAWVYLMWQQYSIAELALGI